MIRPQLLGLSISRPSLSEGPGRENGIHPRMVKLREWDNKRCLQAGWSSRPSPTLIAFQYFSSFFHFLRATWGTTIFNLQAEEKQMQWATQEWILKCWFLQEYLPFQEMIYITLLCSLPKLLWAISESILSEITPHLLPIKGNFHKEQREHVQCRGYLIWQKHPGGPSIFFLADFHLIHEMLRCFH